MTQKMLLISSAARRCCGRSSRAAAAAFSSVPSSTRPLTPDEIAAYQRDGFLLVKGVYDEEEIEMLRKAMENDGHVEGKAIRKEDTDGRLCKLTLWTHNECENTYNMCVSCRFRSLLLNQSIHAQVQPRRQAFWHCQRSDSVVLPRGRSVSPAHQAYAQGAKDWWRLRVAPRREHSLSFQTARNHLAAELLGFMRTSLAIGTKQASSILIRRSRP